MGAGVSIVHTRKIRETHIGCIIHILPPESNNIDVI